MDEKGKSIYVVIWHCEVNLVGIQFSTGKVCNFMELFDDIYANITPIIRMKTKLGCDELTYIKL